MASNKNALIRYNTIDKCLRNRNKQYTLGDLVDACSDALYEYEGKDDLVSLRTIQLDIQNMRSEKLGYNAPIEVYNRKYYRYSDQNYSIKNIPLNNNDLEAMRDAIEILKQFKDFSAFREMNSILHKLEDSIQSTKSKSIIHLDKNELLRGLDFLEPLYKHILNKKALEIRYKSFHSTANKVYLVHPQILKEYNNRWFLISWYANKYITFALDRIEDIEVSNIPYINKNLEPDKYFEHVIGVTVSNSKPQKIIFKADKNNAPYIKTKPFHKSQVQIAEDDTGTTFCIHVQLNLELERLLLGFAEGISILEPKSLQQRIKTKLAIALEQYNNI
ncbi:MAG: WYL domain-containing protein [Bacteroidota bacterium]|nr:WYL domain-containing protein [Bacteroidota bacterium]